MTTADALLAAVIASPDDDLPRLVFADWLDENGDPDRAEFIRLQIGRENGTLPTGIDTREKVLHDTHGERWLAPLRQPGQPLGTQRTHAEFRRGFVDVVWMPARWFLHHAEQLFAAAPVTELRVSFDETSEFWLLAECRPLTRLRTLDVCDQRFGAAGVVEVCRSPHVRGLKVLRLSGCNIDDKAAEFLCTTSLRLNALDLRHNPLSEPARTRLRSRFGNAVVFE